MDPATLALFRLRRRKFEQCKEICTTILQKNPLDQAVWFMKCKALIEEVWIDDTEVEDEGIAEILLDDNAIAALPRPGTSITRPTTGSQPPQSASGNRPVSGYARPGTGTRAPGTASGGSALLEKARTVTGRLNTSRPVTTSGRFVRLNTASLLQDSAEGSQFIIVERLNLKKYAARPALGKILAEYLLHAVKNPTKALELASHGTIAGEYKDWWWHAQVGKCYFALGLLRESERQFNAALRGQEMVSIYLWLAKVALRRDQPRSALDYYLKASQKFPGEPTLLLGAARVHAALGDSPSALALYRRVLGLDPTHPEALSCLASYHLENGNPELGLRYYRRILQLSAAGSVSVELWANLGLACFQAQQWDMALPCFQRALREAPDDSSAATVWYNLGHVGLALGDMGLAYQAWKVAIALDTTGQPEALTNLGILERKKGNIDAARGCFQRAAQLAPHLPEPRFNEALLRYRTGDLQGCYQLVEQTLALSPFHPGALELQSLLRTHFTTL